MTRRALIVVVVAQVAVFAAIAISVVDARDSLDDEVEASFDSAVARLATPTVAVDPLGCRKASLDYYDCRARLTAGARGGTVTYQLNLKDDGCWTTASREARSLPPRFRRPRGCIDD